MPSRSNPSIVVIRLPSCIAAKVMQDKDAAAFDVDGARAALTPIATLLRAGQHQLFTQRVKQGHARFDSQLAGTAVDGQCHLHDTVA